MMWLDASGPVMNLAAIAPLPFTELTSAHLSPRLKQLLLTTKAGEVAIAATAFKIPEALPRLSKQVRVCACLYLCVLCM